VHPPGPAPGLLYAGFWIRFLAYFVDSLILAVPLFGIGAAIAIPSIGTVHCTVVQTQFGQNVTCTGLGGITAAWTVLGLAWLVVSAVYFVVCWTRWGHSLGQRLCGLRVVDAANGERISTGRAIGRYVGILVSSWVLYIGLIWAAFDPRKQGWHDKMASTFVVRRA